MKQKILAFLYIKILKPTFFLFDPELVHTTLIMFGSLLGKTYIGRYLVYLLYGSKPKNITFATITFPTRVGLAAGFDYNADLVDIAPSLSFGFMSVGTITNLPYTGNLKPRLGRFPQSYALLVNKGFKNLGADAIIKKLSEKKFNIPIGVSIGATNKEYKSIHEQVDDIYTCFKKFIDSTVQNSYYELNISCPNTKVTATFISGENLKLLLEKLSLLKITKPIFVKMPIDYSFEEIKKLLDEMKKYNFITGVVFGNLTKDKNNPDMTIEDRELWKIKKGNVSGKPTYARSLELIKKTKEEYKNRFLIIGTGGVMSIEDTKEKLNAGADLIQLITGMIYKGPQLMSQIHNAL